MPGKTFFSAIELAMTYRKVARFEEAEHYAEAEPLFVEAVVDARLHLPPGQRYTGVFLSQYGRCLTNLGRFEDAEKALLETYEIIEPMLDSEHTQRVEAVQNLVTLYQRWDRPLDSQTWKKKLNPDPS